MVSQQRRWLIDSIESLLLPELERHGFRRVPLTPIEARGEIRFAFPFGRLRREGPGGFELVEIQLDKYGAADFRLNLGVAPPGGIEHEVTGRVPQEDIRVHYLDHSYEMSEAGWRKKWFSVRPLPWSEPSKSDYDELVRKVVGWLPEIEALFGEGKVGEHIRERRLR